MNKVVLGLLVVLTIVLIPLSSLSKTTTPDTIVLTKDNSMVLDSQVDGASTAAVIAKAYELDSALNAGLKGKISGSDKPLYLFINSPGGSIQSGLELIEALKGLGRPVNTVTLFGASMAFQIVQNLNERLILKNGVLMSHHAAGEFAGSFGGVSPSQMDSRYQFWLDRVKELDEQTVSRTNGKQTYKSYTEEYDHETWLGGTKSVARGYADRIVTVKCDLTLKGVTTHYASFFGVSLAYDLDNCPINTAPMNIRVADPSTAKSALSTELIEEIKTKFLTQFANKQKQVLPLMF